MFYFPLISSMCEKNSAEESIRRKLENIREDLDRYEHWYNIYEYEGNIMSQEPSNREDYILKLKVIVDKMLG